MISMFLFDWSLYVQEMTWYEAVAALVGVVAIVFLQQGRVLGYPLGILSIGTYVWICYDVKLYAHMGVNAYYLLMNIYGWHYWSKGTSKLNAIHYSYCSRKTYIVMLLGMLLCFGLLCMVLRATDSDVWFWDAFTTIFWAAAMWLLAHKKIENWLFWMVGDAISVPLYLHQGLVMTSLQMLILLSIAMTGFVRWRRIYARQQI